MEADTQDKMHGQESLKTPAASLRLRALEQTEEVTMAMPATLPDVEVAGRAHRR